MEDVEVYASALYLLSVYKYYVAAYTDKKILKKWRRRREWMLTMHRKRTRQTMEEIFTQLSDVPSGEFPNFCHMSSSDFEYLLNKIQPFIIKQDTRLREAIPPKIRLAVTLRYLTSGDSFQCLHNLFKISSQVISRIIPEVCFAIMEALESEVKLPASAEEWLDEEKFSFPHCVGALDGKYIIRSGSEAKNNGTSSIVLLSLVDSDFCFMFAEIGNQGKTTDGVFEQSLWEQKLSSTSISFPPSTPLEGSNINLPYVFVSDGAFPLSTHIMKPFPGYHQESTPQNIFNKRLSSSYVVVENVFGVLTTAFRIFKKPIPLDIQKTSLITMTCIRLHNFLRKSKTSRNIYTPPGTIDTISETDIISEGSWRYETQPSVAIKPIPQEPYREATMAAVQIREEFAKYFAQNV